MAELLEHQSLTLSLKSEKYAIPVGRARPPASKASSACAAGGIPSLDLALRFGLEETKAITNTAVVILKMTEKDGGIVVGLVADAVRVPAEE
jgi:hypothetical protein